RIQAPRVRAREDGRGRPSRGSQPYPSVNLEFAAAAERLYANGTSGRKRATGVRSAVMGAVALLVVLLILAAPAAARANPEPAPPAEVAAAFSEMLGRALALARKRLDANPNDADAHYQLGAAVGLRASYTATVDGSALRAFRAAREAYDEHERVMALDPHRKD